MTYLCSEEVVVLALREVPTAGVGMDIVSFRVMDTLSRQTSTVSQGRCLRTILHPGIFQLPLNYISVLRM